MATHYYTSKKLIVRKPLGVELTEEILRKIKVEYTSEYVFYIYLDTAKNTWYCGTGGAVKISEFKKLFVKEADSILVFGEHLYPSAGSQVEYKPYVEEDGEDWFMVACIGKFDFLSSAHDGARVFFDNFLKFLDIKGVNKMVKKVCDAYKDICYATISRNGVKLIGQNWREKDGISYSSIDFFNKMSFAQKAFFKNVLAFLSGKNVTEELAALDLRGDQFIFEEAQKHPELASKFADF